MHITIVEEGNHFHGRIGMGLNDIDIFRVHGGSEDFLHLLVLVP